jgi:hypothetical protein
MNAKLEATIGNGSLTAASRSWPSAGRSSWAGRLYEGRLAGTKAVTTVRTASVSVAPPGPGRATEAGRCGPASGEGGSP